MKRSVRLVEKALKGDLTALVASSYKNFHSKGLDYICLKRAPEHTVKVYILDGDCTKLSEVVNPHDHRYPFRTTVLTGKLTDSRYRRQDRFGSVYNAFDYMTPLNGGGGFKFRGEERLARVSQNILRAGQSLMTAPDTLHTISSEHDRTIIMLDQWADCMPVDVPTSTWVRKGEPTPDTTGLYDRFTVGEFADKLHWLKGVIA